ncbi:MAG: hypothetical protein CIT03_09515 [Methanobacterium sp.]|nr:MAG: hypothetical protein CIT03_09515 [Methanobacterium sp.]
MIDWKSVLICSGMAIVLSIILSIGGYIIATLYAGYRVGGQYPTGAIHGILVVFIATTFVLMINLLLFKAIPLGLIGVPGTFIISFFALAIFSGIFGSIGGTLGAYIKKRTY